MRIGGRRVRTGKLPLLPMFLAGVVLGIVIMHWGKSLLLDNTGLLDEYSLYHMKYMTVDSNAFFLYVLRVRLKDVALLAVMSTTYLGLAVAGLMTVWYGTAMGMFLSAAVMRYGLKGVLLCLTGVFPQYLCYVPAFVILLLWTEQVCRSIYFKDSVGAETTIRGTLVQRLLQLLIVIAVVAAGCILESYVNPGLVTKLLRIF